MEQDVNETSIIRLDKYKNVNESEIEDIKKILKGKNKANKVKALKNFFQFINTSFQKNSKHISSGKAKKQKTHLITGKKSLVLI